MTIKIDTGGKDLVMAFDFDGTITEEDIFDSIFARYAGPEWWEAHRDYHDEKITLKEAYLEMAKHFRGEEEDLYRFLEEKARLRQGFKELLGRLNGSGVRTLIVSNGFDIYLDYLLRLWKIEIPEDDVRSHHAEIASGRFIPSFNEHRELKHDRCLIGKAEVVEELQKEGKFVGFAGNGHSDTPAARIADLVFARDQMADYCRKNGIAFIPFATFDDISACLF